MKGPSPSPSLSPNLTPDPNPNPNPIPNPNPNQVRRLNRVSRKPSYAYEDGLAIFKCRATDKTNPLNVRARAWSRQESRQFRCDERVVEPSVEPEEEM